MSTLPFDRRRFLVALAAAGFAGGAIAEGDAPEAVAIEDIAAAERTLGLQLTESERQQMAEDLVRLRSSYDEIRTVALPNEVAPALLFVPLTDADSAESHAGEAAPEKIEATRPRAAATAAADALDLAFAPAHDLARRVREGEISSTELVELSLDRLRRFDPILECVIALTEEQAYEEAAAADAALAQGRETSALHGVPWGAKDLLATRRYRTTWGAGAYTEQMIPEDATVVSRLHEAGAPLCAKLSLGALAMGDVWFGGRTNNPWKLDQGSSGSSAGSAAAVSAGLVPFALGSETWGSILSPCTRTGTTGLRPTFGWIPRTGAMALTWSMDKIGPIARDVVDCGLLLELLHGPDGRDATVGDRRFRWRRDLDPTRLRVGVVRSAFEEDRRDEDWKRADLETLSVLESLGIDLIDIELPTRGPDALPIPALSTIISVEAAAAFEDLVRLGRDDDLVRQDRYAWPNTLRQAQFVPAVQYLQANRVRTLAMERMRDLFRTVDAYVCPTYGADNTLLTNLTGHPAVVLPNGVRPDGTPTSITFLGDLFRDGEVLSLAKAYQDATSFHRRRPPIEDLVAAPASRPL